MFDIRLDNLNHDAVLVNNDFELTDTIAESLAQKLKIKLLTFQGEWYINDQEGVPYYQSILGKNRAKETIDNIFKNAILEEPEVISLVSFTSTIDTINRIYNMRFEVNTDDSDENIPIEIEI